MYPKTLDDVFVMYPDLRRLHQDAIREAVEAEREACAKIAEDDARVNASQRDHNPEQFDYWDGANDAAMDIRDAIRARYVVKVTP